MKVDGQKSDGAEGQLEDGIGQEWCALVHSRLERLMGSSALMQEGGRRVWRVCVVWCVIELWESLGHGYGWDHGVVTPCMLHEYRIAYEVRRCP